MKSITADIENTEDIIHVLLKLENEPSVDESKFEGALMLASELTNLSEDALIEMMSTAKEEEEEEPPSQTVILIRPDEETPVSIRNTKLRVDWYESGEGYHGDYNPNDPEDEELLRFDVYVKRPETHEWEEVDDASYCTTVPANTDVEALTKTLQVIFDEYNEVIDDYINGASVKKLGERLSWIKVQK